MNVNAVNGFSNKIYKGAGYVLNKASEIKFVKGFVENAKQDPAKFASRMLLFSIISKDAIGCVLYTWQSLTNKKIPEEKRKFVSALDLVNGILMVGGQTLVGKFLVDQRLIPAAQKYFFKTNKTITEVNGEKTVIEKAPRITEAIENVMKEKESDIEKKFGVKANELNIDKMYKSVEKYTKKPFEKGLALVIAALATTAFIKRTIVPLLSTPIAGWLSNKYDERQFKKKAMNNYNCSIDSSKITENQSQKNVINDKNENLNNLNMPMEYKKQTEQKKVLANG